MGEFRVQSSGLQAWNRQKAWLGPSLAPFLRGVDRPPLSSRTVQEDVSIVHRTLLRTLESRSGRVDEWTLSWSLPLDLIHNRLLSRRSISRPSSFSIQNHRSRGTGEMEMGHTGAAAPPIWDGSLGTNLRPSRNY